MKTAYFIFLIYWLLGVFMCTICSPNPHAFSKGQINLVPLDVAELPQVGTPICVAQESDGDCSNASLDCRPCPRNVSIYTDEGTLLSSSVWPIRCRLNQRALFCLLDPCANLPCLNGGTCENYMGVYKCSCPTNFKGQNCELNTLLKRPGKNHSTSCYDGACFHAGECLESSQGYECKCHYSASGPRCDWSWSSQLISYAYEVAMWTPCFPNGTLYQLTNSYNDYHCECRTGFVGRYCEIEAFVCSDGHCFNGGYCQTEHGQARCLCAKNFTGPRCQYSNVTSGCDNNPCRNGGECITDLDSYHPGAFRCSCAFGYKGLRCEIFILKSQQLRETNPTEYWKWRPAFPNYIASIHCDWYKSRPFRCRNECNTVDSQFDSNKCTSGIFLWQECRPNTRASCWNTFNDGVCDPDCNNPKCYYDGMDCMEELPKCSEKCLKVNANGICEQECDHIGCNYDGHDCAPEAERFLPGGDKYNISEISGSIWKWMAETTIVGEKTLSGYISLSREDKPTWPVLLKLARILRIGVHIDSTPLPQEFRPFSRPNGIKFDRRECFGVCWNKTSDVAAFIAAMERTSPNFLGIPINNLYVEHGRDSTNETWF